MTLVVHELVTFLAQPLTATLKNREIVAVRPHLVKYGNPAGSFYLEIQDQSANPIATSNALTAAEISSASYFHGHVKFDVSATIRLGRTFRVALKSTGYTFSESNYIGWCNDYDSRIYSLGFDDPAIDQMPLDVQIWGYEQARKGIVS